MLQKDIPDYQEIINTARARSNQLTPEEVSGGVHCF